MFRALNGLMAALFAFAVAVQYNDPDAILWMAVYAAACAVALRAAVRGRVAPFVACSLGLFTLAWGAILLARVPGLDVYARMFDAWEMQSVTVEEAREASGLMLVTLWMTVIAVREWVAARARA